MILSFVNLCIVSGLVNVQLRAIFAELEEEFGRIIHYDNFEHFKVSDCVFAASFGFAKMMGGDTC